MRREGIDLIHLTQKGDEVGLFSGCTICEEFLEWLRNY
jgi:hypothetical protein